MLYEYTNNQRSNLCREFLQIKLSLTKMLFIQTYFTVSNQNDFQLKLKHLWECSSVVEHLPSMQKAWSSTLQTRQVWYTTAGLKGASFPTPMELSDFLGNPHSFTLWDQQVNYTVPDCFSHCELCSDEELQLPLFSAKYQTGNLASWWVSAALSDQNKLPIF